MPNSGNSAERDRGNGGMQSVGATQLDPQLTTLLIEMHQEEKLARDVYLTLGKSTGLRIFQNIASAEAKHMQAVQQLVGNQALPAAKLPIGQFSIPKFQTLYDQLVAQGRQSPLAALQVGAKIEEMDIKDLQSVIAQNLPQNVDQVHQHLLMGSRNHLRAFTAQIQSLGGTYQAEFLTQAEFDRTAASGHERGPMSQGPGASSNDNSKGKGFGGKGRR